MKLSYWINENSLQNYTTLNLLKMNMSTYLLIDATWDARTDKSGSATVTIMPTIKQTKITNHSFPDSETLPPIWDPAGAIAVSVPML